MYSTCLFCNRDLGSNEVLEEFPVGRRIAFDAGKGRLWVLCRGCERWNLSPLEERWEAIETAERLFRDSRLRVSTENIGLARLREGLELVRVGRPQRPEMAAWRYGDRFGRRRRRAITTATLGLGAFGAVIAGGTAVGLSIGGFAGFSGMLMDRIIHGSPDRVVTHVKGPDGKSTVVRRQDVAKMRMLSGERPGSWGLRLKMKKRTIEVWDQDALRAAAGVLPPLNRFAGAPKHVRSAVDFLEDAGGPDATFLAAARIARESDRTVDRLPYEVRLAMEMAAHEEAERRALEGELAELEQAWREAEEIAAISDRLLIPESVEAWIRRIRRGDGAEAGSGDPV